MKLFVSCVFMFYCVTDSNAVIISSNGLQRVTSGYSCVFQWKVSESINSFSIYNQTTGSQTPLNTNVYTTVDKINGQVSLTISNVQLSDAGNYSLVVTTATTTLVDSTACLFVYASLLVSVNLIGDSQIATEGDTIVFNCLLTSVSLPAAYRPTVYYSWYVGQYGYFRNVSSGPAIDSNGYIVPGYNISNNGRTLVIRSFQYPNDQNVGCAGVEDGSSFGRSLFFAQFTMRYRPYVSSWTPASKKFTAVVGSSVSLSFGYQAYPTASVTSYWTFRDMDGDSQQLPPNATSYSTSISFSFMSEQYYGNYSITLTNVIGSTTVTFQVVKPGPPDAPSSLRIYYMSHIFIYIYWNLMWSNAITPGQTVTTRLALSDSHAEIQAFNSSYSFENFNSTRSVYFGNNIQPDTSYKVIVWSTNTFGSSEVVQLMVRTRKQPKLIVSPEMITINRTQAFVNFTVELDESMENLAQATALCCSELFGQCASFTKTYTNYYPDVMNGTFKDQIVVNNIANGTFYYVDVTINSGRSNYQYYSNIIKGVRVSRTKEPTPPSINTGSNNSSLLVAVIVLAALLGVALIVLIVILIVYLVKRSRSRGQPNKPPKLPAVRYDTAKESKVVETRPKSEMEDVYEVMEGDQRSNDDHRYTGMRGS